jgi:hypothetical protein
MNTHSIVKCCAVLAALAASLLSGCAAVGRDLVKDGLVCVETTDFDETFRSANIRVIQEKDGATVHGSMKRKRLTMAGRFRGHVHLDVMDAQGNIFKTGTARVRHRNANRKGPKISYFEVLFPGQVPEGSKVKLRYHEGKYD